MCTPVWRCAILLENYPQLKLNVTDVQRKVPTCPGTFLLMNVCNQGKTLCSPCKIACINNFRTEPILYPTSRLQGFETKILEASILSGSMWLQESLGRGEGSNTLGELLYNL